jgi:plasmid maintenance system antidote protein VapI
LALLLEAALGIAAHIWLDLQADYNMHVAKSDTSFMNRLANIRRVAAVL